VSNFQWVWRYSCLNVTHKNRYKRYKGKTNDLFTAFNGHVNDCNKLQQCKVNVQKSHHRLQCNFSSLGNSMCGNPEVVLAYLLYDGSTLHNASDQLVSCVYFFFVDFTFHPSPKTKNRICMHQLQTAVSPHPLKIGHICI